MASLNGALTVTPAATLRRAREEGVPQLLLSGIVVRMRSVTPDMLLKTGRIPDVLTPLVMKMLFPPKEEDNYRFPDEVDNFVFTQRDEQAETLEMIRSVDYVVKAALVYPRVVDKPTQEDEIAVEDLELRDRFWIFRLALMPAEVLSTFRLQPQGDVEAVADEQGDKQQAEPIAVR